MKWNQMMKILKYDAYNQYHDNEGIITKPEEFFDSGIIDCEYIFDVFSYRSVYTQMDLNGPIFVYDDCQMLQTFGPIRKGRKFKTILLDYNTKCVHIDFSNKRKTIRLIFKEV